MGVITHRPWPEEMLQVRGQGLLKASLDALGLPAPAGACDPHICPSARAYGHTGVSLAEHAWACVGMRGPTPGLQGHAMRHACTAAKGTAVPNIGRDTSLRATTHAAHNRCTVQLWRTQVEHAHGCVAWAHLHLCVLDQLEYKVSEEPSSGRATRLVPAHRVPPAAWPSRTSAHDVVA